MSPDITFYASSENPSIITSYLSSVPVAELETLPGRFRKALARAVDEIDMDRMKTVLERQKLQLLESMETDASDTITNVFVSGSSRDDGSRIRRTNSSPRRWHLGKRRWLGPQGVAQGQHALQGPRRLVRQAVGRGAQEVCRFAVLHVVTR